jgi:hypothetical protein
MIKHKEIMTNAIEETTAYLRKIFPNNNYTVQAAINKSVNFIHMKVYINNNSIMRSEIRTLKAELSFLEKENVTFKYDMRYTNSLP